MIIGLIQFSEIKHRLNLISPKGQILPQIKSWYFQIPKLVIYENRSPVNRFYPKFLFVRFVNNQIFSGKYYKLELEYNEYLNC